MNKEIITNILLLLLLLGLVVGGFVAVGLESKYNECVIDREQLIKKQLTTFRGGGYEVVKDVYNNDTEKD